MARRRTLRPVFTLALIASSSLLAAHAGAQEMPTVPVAEEPSEPTPEVAAPSPPPNDAPEQHTWVEARLGSRRWSEKSSGLGGGGFDLALGLGWQWIDVGVVGTWSTTGDGADGSHADIWTVGPEIATRTSIGGGTTFRLAFDPLYGIESLTPGGGLPGSTHSLVGGNVLAQILFTVDDTTRPVWRLGLGAHVGKMWATGGESSAPSWDQAWIVGADVIVRSWW
jgi:hypothetical protein